MVAKPLRNSFDKVDGYIRDYDGTRYLVLFRAEKYASFYSKIRYLIGIKSDTTYGFSHSYAKIKIYAILCL